MAKIWRVIISIVLIALLLGAVFVLVGIITGGTASYVWNLFDARYHLSDMQGMSVGEILHSITGNIPFLQNIIDKIPFIK